MDSRVSDWEKELFGSILLCFGRTSPCPVSGLIGWSEIGDVF
jgi:hypothetical protein